MTEYVRAEQKATGHHVTVPRSVAEGDAYRIIGNPSKTDSVFDHRGQPRPPKFATAKKKTAASPATTTTADKATTKAEEA